MAILPGIIAFFQALPALLQIISRLGLLFDSMLQYANQNNINEWINTLEDQIDALKKAKTSEDKLSAAEKLVGTIRNLGPK